MSDTTSRTLFNPNAAPAPLRREWVTLAGGDVCVWELTAGEYMQAMDHALRPVPGRDGSLIDRQELMLWRVLLSCHKGDEDGAPLLFGPEHVLVVTRLPIRDHEKLVAAINRVCGLTDAEEDANRDFSAGQAPANGSGSPGALTVSGASPRS